mmetsp:Transcript_34355/g.83387  ORF Transcript_34355/g.83387 Transcript_34355/m.83387 type:complete len:370 (+) Transcript_34355:236-1345(+)
MRAFILPIAVLILILNNDDFCGVGVVDALIQPPTSQRHRNLPNLGSVERHSYPRQHQSLQERCSSFSQSSDWYTADSPTSHHATPAVAYQQQERTRTSQNTNEASPNEVLWIRQATMDDIPALQKCNRALLPENYPDKFYENYLQQFPDLTVIVESFSLEESSSPEDYDERGSHNGRSSSSSSSVSSAQPVPVAYAMGCIRDISSSSSTVRERMKQKQQIQYLNKRGTSEDRYGNLVYRPLVLSGHTISLAVMPSHRKMGLATKLLDYLHDSMKHRYGAVVCDLSVRMSNEKAIQLYKSHGYGVSERLYDYYKNEKLEDGFKMQKVLSDYNSGGGGGGGSNSSSESRITLPQQMFVRRPQKELDSVSQW